jgi:hypothetical protein
MTEPGLPRDIEHLWAEELDRLLTHDDVEVLHTTLGVQMFGWYRGDQVTLGVRALARDDGGVALLRIREGDRDQTLFEATSTLTRADAFEQARSQVQAAIRQLTQGSASALSATADSAVAGRQQDRPSPSPWPRRPAPAGLYEVERLTRLIRTAVSRSRKLSRPWESRAVGDTALAYADRLMSIVADSPLLTGQAEAASGEPLLKAWDRARRDHRQFDRPRIDQLVRDADRRRRPSRPDRGWDVADLRDLIDVAQGSPEAARGVFHVSRQLKKRLRSEAMTRLDLALTGYAMLARAIETDDANLAVVAAHLLTASSDRY